jgi:hypothetical protein
MADTTTTATDTTPAAGETAGDTTTGANTVLGGADTPAAADADKPGDTTTTDKTGDQGADKGDGKAGEDGKSTTDKTDDKPAGAPEKYELELPEGFTLDEKVMGEFDPVLRELNLDNTQASKLANLYGKIRQSEVAAYGETVMEWGKQAAADAEIGGKAFPENVELARSALATHGTPELKGLLDSTGLGNHPEVIRFFARVGKTIPKEDGVVKPERSGGSQRDTAAVLFDHPSSKT